MLESSEEHLPNFNRQEIRLCPVSSPVDPLSRICHLDYCLWVRACTYSCVFTVSVVTFSRTVHADQTVWGGGHVTQCD